MKSKTARQTGILYASQLSTLFLGLITAPIITRALGPEQFGILSFILATIGFVALFFEFGFFSAGSRLLALAKEEQTERGLIGALIIITAGIAISFSIIIFIFSFFIDKIFKTEIDNIIRLISILVAVYPFQYMLQIICRGANKIERMSLHNVAPRLWYLFGLLIIVGFSKLSVIIAILLNLTGLIVVTGFIILSLKPSFGNLADHTKAIWKETKEYGIHVYFGRTVDVSTYQLDSMFISYFVNTTQVGFYSLAKTLTGPIASFSTSLSTSLFKVFANREKIPKNIIYFNLIWLSACTLGLGLLAKTIVVILFSDEYLAVVPLVLPLALASFFQGMYQPYIMFVSAHARGKWIRNVAFMMTGINLIGNAILIPLWGAKGAAYASNLSMGFALAVHFRNYIRTLRIEKGFDNAQ